MLQKYFALVVVLCTTLSLSAMTGGQPEELGDVQWNRKMENAVALSQKSGKPILILFQEVPGCITCRNYGNFVLTHPLIVEAIESQFVPLAIYNNKGGADAKALQYFKEPAWNNPVVRIVNESKQDIIPRINGNYSALGLVQGMIHALDLRGSVPPAYLEILQQELRAQVTGTEKANFSMYCFWTGEKELGQIEGVVGTRPGFMDGREVVEVEYDPLLVSLTDLTEKAKEARCAGNVYVDDPNLQKDAAMVVGRGSVKNSSRFRPDGEPKYYLSKTPYKYLPMTPLQRTKANALIGQGIKPDAVLSPRQIELFTAIQNNPNKKWKDTIGEDFEKAWNACVALL
jgi:hypothetical protein